MRRVGFLSLLLCATLDVTMGSTFNPFHGMSIEDSVTYLYEKFLLLENRETSELAKQIRGEIIVEIQNAEKRMLEGKDELAAKIAEVETAFISKHNYLSTRLHDLEERVSKEKEEILNTLSEMSTASRRSFEEVSERLTNEKNGFLLTENQILMEVHQLQRRALETFEKINDVKTEITNVSETGRMKTDMLQVKINETRDLVQSCLASQRETESVIQKTMSSSVEKLRMHVNESLTSGFEDMKTNFDTKMGNLENALLALRKDCVNVSYASSLEESLHNLSNRTKSEFQSIRDELYPRIKGLEETGDSANGATEIKGTLANHSSEISSLNAGLFRIQNRCSDPPSVEDGYPVYSGPEGRNHESVITYGCQGSKIPAGNKVMECQFGNWIGELPQCVDPICNPPCQNEGKCEQNNICNCSLLTSGDRCEKDHPQCGLDLRNVGISGSGIVDEIQNRAISSPWLAAVYIRHIWNPAFLCRGSVIHRNFILTAAGCLTSLKSSDLKVKLGIRARSISSSQEYYVRTIYRHPQYRYPDRLDYGIALLELEKPIDYSQYIRPVCLPPKEIPEDNQFYKTQSSAIGIGTPPRSGTGNFRDIDLVIQPPDICKKVLVNDKPVNITDRMFCAIRVNDIPCIESGGPIVQSHPNKEGTRLWTEVGISIAQTSCFSKEEQSGLYACIHLQKLMPWVEATMEAALKR